MRLSLPNRKTVGYAIAGAGAGALVVGGAAGIMAMGVSLIAYDPAYNRIASFFGCCLTDLCASGVHYAQTRWCDFGSYGGTILGELFECVNPLSQSNATLLCDQVRAYNTNTAIVAASASGAGLGMFLGGWSAARRAKSLPNTDAQTPGAETLTETSALINSTP